MSRDLLWTLAIRLLNTGVGILSAVLTARLLGPEGRGQYYLALTLSATTLQFVSFGMQSSNTYLVAGKPSLFPTLHAGTFWFALVVGGAAAVLVGSAIGEFHLLPSLNIPLIVLAMLGVLPGLYYLMTSNLLVGIGRIKQFNLYETLNRIVPFILILAFWRMASPAAFIGAMVGGFLVVAVFVFRTTHKETGGVLRPDPSLLKSGLAYGARAYVTTMLGFLLSRLSVFLLARLGTPDGLGHFSIAMQIADMMSIIPATVSLLLFPKLVQAGMNRNSILAKNLLGVGTIMLIGCAAAGVLAPSLLPWLFGQHYAPAVKMLIWMLPGIFFLSLITVLSQYLAAIGFPWSVPAAWLSGVVILIATGIPLIDRYGATGASMSISLAYFAVLSAIGGLCFSHYRVAKRRLENRT
jgi:O-antigen/teichoic acid export membrane protein